MKLLLRFITGSDLLIDSNKTITVEFVEMSEFSRRPVSRSQTVQFAEQYESYTEFRAELNNILKSNVWIFDYV